VGQRSSTETVISILKAFLDVRTWKQADLARRVGVQPATLHKRLVELRAIGIPLHDEREHPHVFWSVPRSWYPGGVLFTGEQVTQVFRHLSRIPRSKARDRLLESLLEYLPALDAATAIIPAGTTAREEQHLPVIEDAATQKVALELRYLTVTRGKEGVRHASVHRVLVGPPARFIATCHRSGDLKWFRVENVSDARLDPREPFRDADPKKVDAYLRASLDGFHDGGAATRQVFFVSDPDARWVARNLMDGMQCEEVPGGIRVTLETAAPSRLARYVVGLGAAAKPMSPELERAVIALAEGALASVKAGPQEPSVADPDSDAGPVAARDARFAPRVRR
jgi:predicted DNA-binding transcriptional regulator YafY